MFRYLRAAFFVRERVPFLGRLPVNLMAIGAFAALGFGHPAFWLIGLIGEVAFLWALTGSKRFRKLVDASELAQSSRTNAETESLILSTLSPERRQRYEALQESLTVIQANRSRNSTGDSPLFDDLDSYRELLQIFLRRLQTGEKLTSPHRKEDLESIRNRAAAVARELEENQKLTSAARESREKTLEILHRRIAVYERRKDTLDEIRSDLERIEEQFHLALESSEIRGDLDTTRFDLNLASNMINTPSYLAFADEPVDEPFPVEMERE